MKKGNMFAIIVIVLSVVAIVGVSLLMSNFESIEDTIVEEHSHEISKGKHCSYSVGCNCSGFSPKTNGKEWEKSYCKHCGHHKKYHR